MGRHKSVQKVCVHGYNNSSLAKLTTAPDGTPYRIKSDNRPCRISVKVSHTHFLLGELTLSDTRIGVVCHFLVLLHVLDGELIPIINVLHVKELPRLKTVAAWAETARNHNLLNLNSNSHIKKLQ